MENKEWIEPELIVLVRSNPEEAVLVTCKAHINETHGPNGLNTHSRCDSTVGGCAMCDEEVES
jgi:hypothetical protein